MRDPRARRKADRIAGTKAMQRAVEPNVGCAFDHVDEFFFGALRVRVGGTPAGEQPLVMDAEARQPEMPSEGRADARQLVIVLVVDVVGSFNVGPVGNAVGV